MLRFIEEYVHVPVFSVRGGRRISTTIDVLLNPHKLQVIGVYCDDRASGEDKILLLEDVREIGPEGIIIDSEDNLMDPNDLVRLEDIIDMNYSLTGKKLITESGKKLGNVENYAIDDITYKVMKIYGKPMAYKTLHTNDYIIARRQIASINQDEVIVKDAAVQGGNRARRPSFNPIRP